MYQTNKNLKPRENFSFDIYSEFTPEHCFEWTSHNTRYQQRHSLGGNTFVNFRVRPV